MNKTLPASVPRDIATLVWCIDELCNIVEHLDSETVDTIRTMLCNRFGYDYTD
jgi:hypothetical protein